MCEFANHLQSSDKQSHPADDLRFYLPLFNAAGEGMVVVNGKGEIVLINDRVVQLFGYDKEELKGRSIATLIPSDLRKSHDEYVTRYFNQPKPRMMSQSNNLFGLKKDGSRFPVEVSLNHFLVGEESFAVGVINDVSARKMQERKIIELNEQLERKVQERTERLMKSEHLYRTISSNFPDGIIKVLNLDFEYVFAEGKELLNIGIDKDELLNKPYAETIDEESRDHVMQLLEEVKNGNQMSFELSVGASFYHVDAVPLHESSGEVSQILVIEKNITNKKKAEEEIIGALEKERELSTLKSRFVSMASHEFRTPLGAILSSVSLKTKYQEQGKGDDFSIAIPRDDLASIVGTSTESVIRVLSDFKSEKWIEVKGSNITIKDELALKNLFY